MSSDATKQAPIKGGCALAWTLLVPFVPKNKKAGDFCAEARWNKVEPQSRFFDLSLSSLRLNAAIPVRIMLFPTTAEPWLIVTPTRHG